jgi:hypothetical protein
MGSWGGKKKNQEKIHHDTPVLGQPSCSCVFIKRTTN